MPALAPRALVLALATVGVAAPAAAATHQEIPRADPSPARRPAPKHKGPAATGPLHPEAAAAPPAEEAEAVEEVDVGASAGAEGGKDGGIHANADALMGDDYPQLDRVLDHLTGKVTRARTFETLIGHRNYEGLLANPWRDLLGFDGGNLKVMLGVRYGVLDIFDIGLARMNRTLERFTTWEVDSKVQIFRQEAVGLDIALRLGLDIFESPTSTSAGVLAQVLASRTLGDRALVGAGILFSSLSSGPFKRDSDQPTSTAIMLQSELRILETLSLAGELTYAVAGFAERWPVITYGPKIVTNRHTFSIIVSNSQFTTADSLVTNTYRSNWRDWLLGFHITREI